MPEDPLRVERGTSPTSEPVGGRGPTVPRPRDQSTDQADGASDDSRTDVPAELTVHAHPADAGEAALSDEDIAEFQRRVAEGFYNSPAVADEVARRMQRKGDI